MFEPLYVHMLEKTLPRTSFPAFLADVTSISIKTGETGGPKRAAAKERAAKEIDAYFTNQLRCKGVSDADIATWRAQFISPTDQAPSYLSQIVRTFSVNQEPEIVNIFCEDTYTLIEWEERRQLDSRANLALWLHSFLTTHEKPFDYSVAKYYELSGSKVKNMFHFRARLKKALQNLVDIRFLEDFSIDGRDMVHVTRRNRSLPGQAKRILG